MLTLILLVPVLLGVFLLTRVIRLFTRPFRPYGRSYNPYGSRPALFGYRRRHPRMGRGLLTILGLYALDQFFTNRRP